MSNKQDDSHFTCYGLVCSYLSKLGFLDTNSVDTVVKIAVLVIVVLPSTGSIQEFVLKPISQIVDRHAQVAGLLNVCWIVKSVFLSEGLPRMSPLEFHVFYETVAIVVLVSKRAFLILARTGVEVLALDALAISA